MMGVFCQKIVRVARIPILWLVLTAQPGCEKSASEREKNPVFKDYSTKLNLEFYHKAVAGDCYYMPESIGSGVALFDFDNDDDLDIYLINGADHHKPNSEKWQNRLFEQKADGSFDDVTEKSGLGDTGFGMGVAVGDINNDGLDDIYVTNYGQDAIYLNQGNGRFVNITQSAGIDNDAWACSAAFFDYDLDGFLDLYVTNYVAYDSNFKCLDKAGLLEYCGPKAYPGVRDKLFRNNGDDTFTDVSRQSGIAAKPANGLGVVVADFDDDFLPDIYVANDAEPNMLWINNGDGTFKDRALEYGVALNQLGREEASMGIAIGDLSNNQGYDLFLTHLRGESNTLYEFSADYGYMDRSDEVGLSLPSLVALTGFGTGFLDFDHDGDLDIVVANGRILRGENLTGKETPAHWDLYAEPNMLLENRRGTFVERSHTDDDFVAQIATSRGLALGDVDNDGDIDLLVANTGEMARLYFNELEPKGNWLKVRAFDPALRRDAIGAEVIVKVAGTTYRRLVTPAFGYLSSNDKYVHFGLGAAEFVDQISIRWPGGTIETFPGVETNQAITLNRNK